MNHIAKLTSSIENQLEKQTKDFAQAGADVLVVMELKEKGKR
jgi:hypothetical protein